MRLLPHLFSVGWRQRAIAVLCEAKLHGHVEWQCVLPLGEVLRDRDCTMDCLVRAAQTKQVLTVNGTCYMPSFKLEDP